MDQPTAWFPIRYQLLDDVRTGRVLYGHPKYQILEAEGAASRLLVCQPETADAWMESGLLLEGALQSVSYGKTLFMALPSDARMLAPAAKLQQPGSLSEALAFAVAVRRSFQTLPDGNFSSAVYCEKFAVLLPVADFEESLSPDLLIGRYLTGGAHVPATNGRRIKALVPWLPERDLRSINEAGGLQMRRQTSKTAASDKRVEANSGSPQESMSKPVQFELTGRPQLETFFRDHVIEIVENLEKYQRLGIDFPGGIVLYGPPGCGKTYAVERLVDYLDWPCFNIDSASIGSPYIHETGRKIAEVFDKAMDQTPSIIVIDEMEAFLSDRETGGGHRVEEVAEFLRRIPEAISKHVLIIGMTNRPDAIDPAILRRGRFDHMVEVPMASRSEIEALLRKLFSQRPCALEELPVADISAVLEGRPLSDVAFLVRESARLAGKADKSRIDLETVQEALASPIFKEQQNKKGFGFISS